MDSRMQMYYKSSGKINNISILYFLISCIVIFPLIGYVYTYISILIYLIPFRMLTIIVSVLIPIILGFIIGLYLSIVIIIFGKIRNVLIASLFVILGALFVMYFHWIFYLDINYEYNLNNVLSIDRGGSINWDNIIDLLFNPSKFIQTIKEAYLLQIKGEGNGVISNLLLLLWIIEIIIVVGISIYIGVPQAKKPFSEKENAWLNENEFMMNYIENKDEVINNLENNRNTSFKNCFRVNNKDKNHSIFELYESNLGENYLSITNKMITKKNRKGEIKVKNIPIVKYIKLSTELKNYLLKI